VGFRAFDVPVRTTANQRIPARGVEGSVEVLRAPSVRDRGLPAQVVDELARYAAWVDWSVGWRRGSASAAVLGPRSAV
jgi:hypothetical protein